MLTYKIGVKDIKRENLPLEIEKSGSKYVVWESGDTITINSPTHGVLVGDTITFMRSDGNIEFVDSTEATNVIDKDTFEIPAFPDKLLPIKAGGMNALMYHPQHGANFVVFSLMDEEHDFVENRLVGKYSGKTTYISEFIYGNYSNYEEDSKRCDGDYVLYEDTFLYTATVGSDGKYSFGTSDIKNTTTTIWAVLDEETITELNLTDGSQGSGWNYNGGILYLQNCIIPVTKSGNNDRHLILWRADDQLIGYTIARKCPKLALYAKDERFIKETNETSENGVKCILTNGTSIHKTTYSAIFSEPLLQDFGANLFQEDSLRESYVNRIINAAKNKIVDYEKKCFSPVYGEDKLDAEELRFNLHFRERPVNAITDEGENVIGYTFDEWKTSDDLYWNNYTNNNGVLVPTHSNTPEEADLLGYLGLTDNDVIGTKNKISHSFLRLSFYDTQDRRTQRLLFTSTIFLNAQKLYGQYSTNVRTGAVKDGYAIPIDGIEPEYVFTEHPTERICASFKCRSKYESDESSEGFYIYLFPGLLDESGTGRIYMKAEFSHAKYGYTIPMTLPMTNDGTPIDPTDSSFPKTYESGGYVNMKKLYNDMYIGVNIEFDPKRNGYIWYFDKIGDDGIINLNLFEPKLNIGEDYQVSLNNAGEVSYLGGTVQGKVSVPAGKRWEVLSQDAGITISPQNGTGTQTIDVTITPNTGESSGSTRQLTATFSCNGKTFTLSVIQSRANYPFSVTPSSLESSWEGIQTSITINDPERMGWTITRRDYVDITPTSGTGTATLPVIFGVNRTSRSLSGSIIVRDNTFNTDNTVYVTQRAVDSAWNGSPTGPLNFNSGGGEFIVTINDPDNFGYRIAQCPYWIALTEETHNGNTYTLKFSVDVNPETIGRSVWLKIRDNDVDLFSYDVFIEQAGNQAVGYIELWQGVGNFYTSSQGYYIQGTVEITSNRYGEIVASWMDPAPDYADTRYGNSWYSISAGVERLDPKYYGDTLTVEWEVAYWDDLQQAGVVADSGRFTIQVPNSAIPGETAGIRVTPPDVYYNV